MPYEQIRIVKVARPDTPEGYMIINAADYRADLPPWMYAEGLAYDPAVYPPYVEPVLAAKKEGGSEVSPPAPAHGSATQDAVVAEAAEAPHEHPARGRR